MDASPVQSQTAATSPSSPGAGNYNVPGNISPKMDAPKEDSKFKESEEDDLIDDTNTDLDMLTIEDSTLDKVPIHLENLLHSFDVEKSTAADLLIALIYGVALECSFAAIDEVQKFASLKGISNQSASAFHSKHVKLLSNMPSDIYDANKMTYTLRLQLYFDPTGSACLMTGILTGDLLIITLTPDCGVAVAGKSICLSIGRYVLNANGRPFPNRLRKLPELSYKLREQVLVPIRKHLIQRDDIVILYPSLEGLPEELYSYLYAYLNKNSLNKLSNVCKRLLSTVVHYEIYQKRFSKRKKLKL